MLPIETLRPAFERTLSEPPKPWVVTAPTGSGKSTRLPLWCVEAGWRTLVVEPRRLACRSLARFAAQNAGSPLGGRVGYAVRHEAVFGAQTRLLYATPGVVLRMIQEGQGRLLGWDALILDEFHERQIEVDLLLGLARRPNFGPSRLLVMSATLQGERLARFLGAHLLEGQGRTFPVTVEHTEDTPTPTERDLDVRVVAAVERALPHEGDVLVFLPGKGEIAAAARALRGLAERAGLELVPLHGDLQPEEQDRVFAQEGPRRVILSTNVAETSLTVPRVGVVIDAGLVRQTRYHHGEGILRLLPIAQDSADQRTGRAGRVRAGHCIRLWSRSARLEPVTRPELLRESLSDAALWVASCGTHLGALDLLDPPPEYALRAATEELTRLGCLGGEEAAPSITPVGRKVAALPLDALLGRVLVAAQGLVERQGAPARLLYDAIDLVAALGSGRDIVLPHRGAPSPEREAWSEPRCDATLLVLAMRHGKAPRDALHPWALQEARQVARQLRDAFGLGPPPKDLEVERRWLCRAWIEADPRSAYVRRPRGGKGFSNEGEEVQPDRDSLVSAEAEALVAAQIYTMRDRRVVHLATCAIPARLAWLREAGLGRAILGAVRVERGKSIVAQVRLHIAGHDLDEREEVPTGPLAREALKVLLRRGSLFRTTIEANRALASGWNLYRKLKGLQAPPTDADAWLDAQVEAVGLESGEDLALLSASDFAMPAPAGFDEAEQRWLEKTYPQTVHALNASYAVEYDLVRRTVTIEPHDKNRHQPPPLGQLPGWSGWRIQHRRASNITVLRG
jgi:HrpA-like RNA helicase